MAWNRIGFVLCAVVALGLVLFFAQLVGCGVGKTACSIIDTAAEACVVLRYLGPDGKVHDVRVPRSELEGFARMSAAQQAALCDGGDCADGGAP